MIGYTCAGCARPFCWGCDRVLDVSHELKATTVPRYCEGCIAAEAEANGVAVDTVRAVRSRRKREACDHTRGWALKVRSNPGAQISTNFECPEHGMFSLTVERTASGDPPDEVPCPAHGMELVNRADAEHFESHTVCGLASPWRPTAPMGRVALGQVVQGKVGEYPPDHMCLDTRALADGMPKHEWRAQQEKITRDANFRKRREREGAKKVHFT